MKTEKMIIREKGKEYEQKYVMYGPLKNPRIKFIGKAKELVILA